MVLVFVLTVTQAACIRLQSYHDDEAIPLKFSVPSCKYSDSSPCLEMRALEFTDRGNLLQLNQLEQLSARIQEMQVKYKATPNVVVYVHGWHHNAKSTDPDLQQFKDRLQTFATLENFNDRPTIGVYVGWRGDSIGIRGVNFLTYYGRKRTAEIVGRTGLRQAVLRLESEVQRLDGRFILIGHSFGTNAVLSAVQGDLIGRANEGNLCHLEREERENSQKYHNDEIRQRFSICMRAARFGHGVYLFNPAIEANAFSPLRSSMTGRDFDRNQPKLLHVVATKAETGARTAFSIAQRLLNTLWSVDRSDVALGNLCTGEACHSEVDLMTTTMGQYAPYWTGSMSNSQPGRHDAIWRFQHIKGVCRSVLLPASTKVIGGGLAGKPLDPAHPDYLEQNQQCRESSGAIPGDWVPYVIKKHIPARISDPIQVTIADWEFDESVPARDMFMKDHNAQLCTAPFAYITTAVLENDDHNRQLNEMDRFREDHNPSGVETRVERKDGCSGSFDFSQCFSEMRKAYRKDPSKLDDARCY